MENNKTQWQKRVDTTQYLYSSLVKDLKGEQLKTDFFNADNYNFDANQLKLLEYYCLHQDEIIKLFSNNLGKNWTWARIAPMAQAILIVCYCEVKVLNTPVAVAIDQALVTADKYGQLDNKKFINAILDKVLKAKI